MNIGDKIYTRKHVGTIKDIINDDKFGIYFVSRKGTETNYNIVTKILIENMMEEREWFFNNDPFKN